MTRLIESCGTTRVEGRVRFVENEGKEWTESWQAGRVDTNAELDEVPDRVGVFVGVVWGGEEAAEENFFNDGSRASKEAEGKNQNQGNLGLEVDLQTPDNWNWKDGEEEIGGDVDG